VALGLVRDYRSAVWGHGSGCDVRLGFQHRRPVGEQERFTCQVEGAGQGLLVVPSLGPDDDADVVQMFDLDQRVN
jgi:hypothetical protein